MDIKVELISSQQTWPLRHQVLRPHQTLNECVYPQDDQATAFHVGALSQGLVVSIASFHEESFPSLSARLPYRLRGMATEPRFRQMNLGRWVLEKGITELSLRGCDLLWCNAREVAFPFYEKMGLQMIGPMFDIPGLGPHKVMYKYLR